MLGSVAERFSSLCDPSMSPSDCILELSGINRRNKTSLLSCFVEIDKDEISFFLFPRDSSVGRAVDCSSICHVFKSHSRDCFRSSVG